MNLIVWIEDENAHIDSGLLGTPIESPITDQDEILLPFSSRQNAIDCLRIIIRALERGDTE